MLLLTNLDECFRGCFIFFGVLTVAVTLYVHLAVREVNPEEFDFKSDSVFEVCISFRSTVWPAD